MGGAGVTGVSTGCISIPGSSSWSLTPTLDADEEPSAAGVLIDDAAGAAALRCDVPGGVERDINKFTSLIAPWSHQLVKNQLSHQAN
jgi:hypothetical protein